MTEYDQLVTTIALTLGVGWASGINLYAAVLTLGVLHHMGHVSLPPGLDVVAAPVVIAAAGFMYFVEFFADKTPGVDSGWDGLHTFIRLPAGAVLAAAAVGDVSPAIQVAAAMGGGALSAGSHALKAGGRLVINTSPEPVSNWTASLAEDGAVIGGLWVALNHPSLFLLALVVFVVLLVWLLPKIWRGVRRVFHALGRWLGNNDPPPVSPLAEREYPALPQPDRER